MVSLWSWSSSRRPSADSKLRRHMAFKTSQAATVGKSGPSKKPWLPEGGARKTNLGRGDCVFFAVADALAELHPAKQASGRSLRAFLVAYYEKHKDKFAALWDGLKPGVTSRHGGDDKAICLYFDKQMQHYEFLPGSVLEFGRLR